MMKELREYNFDDKYTLFYTLDGLRVKLWAIEDSNGNDISTRVDRYDWEYFQQRIASDLHTTFCYFDEC